jgi:phosphate transport system protein
MAEMRQTGPSPLDGQGFRRHLDELDLGVRTLSELLIDGIPRATLAFLHGDEALAAAVVAAHAAVKGVPDSLEETVGIDIARRSPMGSDLRFLVSVLRVAPALGRCLELVDHVVDRRWVGPLLPAGAASTFAEMGGLVTGMWESATLAWCQADDAGVPKLPDSDERLDVLVTGLPRLLRHPDLTPLAAMQAITVGRFYERLGDHAVDFARRARWCATGT